MRIKILHTFDDLTKPEDDRRVEAETKLTVTADRGAELIALGLAEAIGGDQADASDTSTTEN